MGEVSKLRSPGGRGGEKKERSEGVPGEGTPKTGGKKKLGKTTYMRPSKGHCRRPKW